MNPNTSTVAIKTLKGISMTDSEINIPNLVVEGAERPPRDSADERYSLWHDATSVTTPYVNAVVDYCLFPSSDIPDFILVAQAHFTNTGVFLIGLTEIKKSDELDASLAGFAMGGILGGLIFGARQSAQLRREISGMKGRYSKAESDLKKASLEELFVKAPHTVHYLSPCEVTGITWPESGQTAASVQTIFGPIEFEIPESGRLRSGLETWWRGMECRRSENSTGQAAFNWTRHKVAVYFHKFDESDDFGMIPYLAKGGNDSEATSKHVYSLVNMVKWGLGDQFWRVIDAVYAFDTPSAHEFASSAAKFMAKKSRNKFVIAGVCLAGCVLMIWFLWAVPKNKEEIDRDQIAVGVLAFILAFTAFVQFIRGFSAVRQSKQYAK